MLTEEEKKVLKLNIQANRHEVFLVSLEEMDEIIRSNPFIHGTDLRENWRLFKDSLNFGATYTAAAQDIVVLSKLVKDLGGIGTKAYLKTYGGKVHIILKGRPGLRKILTGTKYGIKNPKIISMGLGKAGAIKAAKTGGILTIVLLTVYRVVDYLLTDEATLSQLVGRLATDIVKVGIATGASIAAAAVMGGFTIAIGPILAVVVVGIGISLALDELDEYFGITDRIILGLDELGDDARAFIDRKKETINEAAEKAVEKVIDYAINSAQKIVVRLLHQYLNKFLSPLPRFF